jgi:predicted kinase
LTTARDYRPAPERSNDLAERLDRPALALERRLAKLPDGHPSGAGYADGRGRPDEIRPLTDAEHAEHVAEVEAKLEEARAAGLATNLQHTIDPRRVFWSAERESVHDSIVQDLYEAAETVPCEGKAILAGGLPGSGKSTVLGEQPDIGAFAYMTINPDAVKEELARRGLIPELPGLSPMEASDLVHEESSHIAKRLAQLAQADRRNVIWDVTMSSVTSTEKRIDLLRASGYSEVRGIFVDIPVDVSVGRALDRHREGHEIYLSGTGLGGRYVSPDMIRAQGDPEWGSQNRRAFEAVKERFDVWSLYDNSVDGQDAVLIDSGRWIRDDRNEERREQ